MTFPIFEHLHQYLSEKGTLKGACIGWHCHLTELTEIAVSAVISLGAELHLSECNASTTDLASVERMRKAGANVYLGQNSADKVLDAKPIVISDTGFHLTSQYLGLNANWLYGGCEITTSGITKLRKLILPIPVFNLNDTTLKSTIENFHGVGDGLIEALTKLGKNFKSCNVAVFGYGQVGAGCAHYLREAGSLVSVVEVDSVRALKAHYDGFLLQTQQEALKGSELIITASGKPSLLSADDWQLAKDGVLIANVGHFADELDLPSLANIAEKTLISATLAEYLIDKGSSAYKGEPKRIYVATEGHPVNVVLLTGSEEPTLIHLATEVLALAHLIELNQNGQKLAPGENALPRQIEELASLLALRSLNLSYNSGSTTHENKQKLDRDLESSSQTC
ncbi:MAG: hypothetical protein K2Y22_12345 [Candidatus Obscuribacterales bacterium]|nr:hypothetical protein [Candidatus Obscuribacterales bacterium]